MTTVPDQRTPAQHAGDPQLPPSDADAERAILASCMHAPTAIDDATTHVRSVDFYDTRHQAIWNALRTLHTTGRPTDPNTVRAELDRRATTNDDRSPRIDPLYLLDIYSNDYATAAQAGYYAQRVAALAASRRIIRAGTQLIQYGYTADSDDIDELRTRARAYLDDEIQPRQQPAPIPTIDQILTTPDYHDWLIPGLIEKADRTIVTAGEGVGKSTLLRQIAVQAASGIHPFTYELIDPIRVLHVDLENSERQSRREYRPLRDRAADLLDPDLLRLAIRPEGLDLTGDTDEAWLDHAITETRAQLVVIGPLYKLANGDPTEEKAAKPAALAIDRLRVRHDCAVILEAHSAKAPSGSRRRPPEPYGWSGWMRWPEFGLHLAEDGTITHWRGQRETRAWPTLLQRGGDWPWTPVRDPAELRWALIRTTREKHGQHMTIREVAEATRISRSTVARIIADRDIEWQTINGHPDTDPET